MEPVPRSFDRTFLFWSIAGPYLIRSNPAVAVPVEPQDEHARLLDEFLARNLAILVFVKITKIRVRQGRVGLADRFKLGLVQISVVIAIRRRKQAVGIF